MELVLKTSGQKCLVGSNPTASAKSWSQSSSEAKAHLGEYAQNQILQVAEKKCVMSELKGIL